MDEIREIAWREYGVTDLEPLTLAITLAMGILLLGMRRAYAVVPLLVVCCLIPSSQRLVVATLDFNMVRILVLFGWARVLLRGELRGIRPGPMDLVLVAWLVSSSTIAVLRVGSLASAVMWLGLSFDALGVYLLFRILLRDLEDLWRAISAMAWITVPIALFMIAEWLSGWNLFSLLGGVRAQTAVRDGELRCMGAFAHPILAGTFGAFMAPLIWGRGRARGRLDAVTTLGMLSAVVIVLASGSGGPIMALAAGGGAWALWRWRHRLRLLRWVGLFGAIVIHFARAKPIWHLVARTSSIVGGTGYHRYRLMDAFVRNFDEWWLLGLSGTAHWGWGLQDLTNQYVANGVRGGLLTLLLFVLLLGLGFAAVGRALRRHRRVAAQGLPARPDYRFLYWGLGVALFTHCVSFISVTYFGQMQYVFYLTLAMIASLSGMLDRFELGVQRAPVTAAVPPWSEAAATA